MCLLAIVNLLPVPTLDGYNLLAASVSPPLFETL